MSLFIHKGALLMFKKFACVILLSIVCVVLGGCRVEGESRVIANTVSYDGVPIAYSVFGKGDVTLVFVHGWSCDSRYWYQQIPYFSKKYQVVVVDLAGHGNSGSGRATYTMESFGQDVVAVLKAIDAKKAILAGHSMGGAVILQAARIAPDRIIGLIGVDTFQDLGRRWSEQEIHDFYDPLAADFPKNAAAAVKSMFTENADTRLRDTVASDIASAPPAIALSAMSEYLMTVEEDLVQHTSIPIKCVNADLWPTNVERNSRLAPEFELALMKGHGHFLMLEAPDAFNQLLEKMLRKIEKEYFY
jgi:pimeloyl-ACP methyl ester carboxylesterase